MLSKLAWKKALVLVELYKLRNILCSNFIGLCVLQNQGFKPGWDLGCVSYGTMELILVENLAFVSFRAWELILVEKLAEWPLEHDKLVRSDLGTE